MNETNIFLDCETTGLNFYRDRITCICVVVEDDTDEIVSKTFFDEDEKTLLLDFREFIESYEKDVKNAKIFTWNGKDFDIPFIIFRLLFYGESIRMPNHIDVKDFFQKTKVFGIERRPSLSEAASFLSIKTEKLYSGEEAIYLFKHGLYEELKKYCLTDVEILRVIFLKLKYNNMTKGVEKNGNS